MRLGGGEMGKGSRAEGGEGVGSEMKRGEGRQGADGEWPAEDGGGRRREGAGKDGALHDRRRAVAESARERVKGLGNSRPWFVAFYE